MNPYCMKLAAACSDKDLNSHKFESAIENPY